MAQATHGQHNTLRASGSIGACSYPGRVFKGMRMAGQMGNVRITTQNLTVVKLLEDDNLILVQGSVPGSKNGIIMISDAYKHKLPDEAPFPAGLFVNNSKVVKEEEFAPDTDIKKLDSENNDVKSDKLGGDVED